MSYQIPYGSNNRASNLSKSNGAKIALVRGKYTLVLALANQDSGVKSSTHGQGQQVSVGIFRIEILKISGLKNDKCLK